MVRPHFKSAAVLVLLIRTCVAPVLLAATASAYTLPPEPKPTTHWPWWLRILAVIFVLVFIRIVAGSVRSKPSGPGPV